MLKVTKGVSVLAEEVKSWTPAQQNAIDAKGGTVLVSAAAGSGKTAVLVERIIRRLTDRKDPLEPSRLVMVTFTEAAAAEMRGRLEKALQSELAKNPADSLLRRQCLLLPMARISTVHSFCMRLLRDHAHLLGLSPEFKILPAEQVRELLTEAIRETVEERYAARDADFARLVDCLSAKKNDRPIVEAVGQLYDYVTKSFAFPDTWLREQETKLDDGGAAARELRDKLFRRTLKWQAAHALSLTERALALLPPEDAFAITRIPHLLNNKQFLSDLLPRIDELSTEELWNALKNRTEVKVGNAPKGTDPDFKKRIEDLRNGAKDCLSKVFWFDEDEFSTKADALSRPIVRLLIGLYREANKRFTVKKRDQNGLDFNDLEHLTLQLLYQDGSLTETAAEIAEQFDEILIDEYQDTNEVQDAIFRAVSKNESNLFFVGDVKQSIYGFRQARSKLFIHQQNKGCEFDGVHYPATVMLSNNFRSRSEVTDAINFLFRQMMIEPIGGIHYGEKEALYPSAKYEQEGGLPYHTELTFLQDDGKDTAEAQVIAADIRRMVGSLPIQSKQGVRPAEYRDICIILRSIKGHAEAFVKELKRLGIPAVCNRREPLSDAVEIRTVLELLRFLDNPSLSISMVSAMTSPLWQFTVDDLALLRLKNKNASLYANLRKTAREEGELAEKCRLFLSATEHWRTLSPVLPIDRLIERIYDDLSIEHIYGVQENGRQAVANLRMLHTRARNFEENGYRGLSAFVRMWDRLEESGTDLDQAFADEGDFNAVSVITVHKSKGLEYPIVFLARGGGEFNRQEWSKPLVFNADAGIGLKLHDADTYLQYSNTTHALAAAVGRMEQNEEELRMLYVALTRAREKLCIVCSTKNLADKVNKLTLHPNELVNGQLPEYVVAGANSYLDWLLPAALAHPDSEELWQLGTGDRPVIADAPPLDIRVLFGTPEDPETAEDDRAQTAQADEAMIDGWRSRIGWKYPYYEMRDIPNKLAVADIAHREADDRYVATSAPAFLQTSGLTAAERGTAMHQFMQFADYGAAAVSVTDEIQRLTDKRWLSQKQAESLSVKRLEAFFQSDLYRRMSEAEAVCRELPFVTERAAAELFPDKPLTGAAATELLAVQGVADCVVVEKDGILIVDYKTDRVKNGDQLRERYAVQVEIYAEAMSKAFGLPTKQRLLWSFELNEAVEV